VTRNRTIYLQRKAKEALEKEFGFAPARLNKIVLLEADGDCFHIRFRVGGHYYNYHYGRIERTNDRGAPLLN
jgi:hypothetical protein